MIWCAIYHNGYGVYRDGLYSYGVYDSESDIDLEPRPEHGVKTKMMRGSTGPTADFVSPCLQIAS